MILLQQAGAVVTLSLQCGGAAALILWIRSIPRETQRVRVFHCASLVMQTTVAVIVLHGIVILLWASCYRGLCLPLGNQLSTSRRAATRQLDMGTWSFRRSGAC